MIRAVFIDFDWTLYSHSSMSIPVSAINALKCVHKKGVKIFLATGRSIDELDIVPDVYNIPFDGYVLTNGQTCYDRERNIIKKNPIHGPMLDELVSIFNEKEQSVVFVAENRSYINFESPRVIEAHKCVSYIKHPVQEYDGCPVYLAVFFPDEKEETLLKQRLYDCDFKRWGPLGIDVLPKGVDKVTGIKFFLEANGIDRHECLTIGDSFNDIQMLEFAGTSVAMGNAEQCVKDVASYVTDNIDNDGLYNAFRHFDLI